MKLKRIGCVLLALILSLAIATPVNSYAAAKFSDTRGHWAESYINAAVDDGFADGYPGGKFLPDKAVTRAEFASMVNKALGNSGTANLNFYDVNNGNWFYNDVSKAVAAAYAAGYSDGSFKPNSPITRQEAAVMLARIVTTDGGGNLNAYPDHNSIADWAYDAMEKINGKDYIGAYDDGRIHPLDRLTRAQTAKILCDILDHENIVTGNTTADDDGTRLSGKIYTNNVTIHKNLGEGDALIDNCVILGNLYVYGGGDNSVTISNTRVANAIVDKGSDPVHILAKGETAIAALSAEESSILQTSGLTGGFLGPGYNSINIKASAEVTLKGSFPKISVIGSEASVTLDSGTINDLTISSSGKYSHITAESGTSIGNVTVNAEAYFHGPGTISHMGVNADNVTYETKPKNWTIASSAETPSSADANFDVIFSPKNKADDVKLDAKITITFSSAMEMHDGDSITSSDIEDFITVRKGSSSGTKIGFSASINSAKKVITIMPDSYLAENTKYYVTLIEDSIRDDDGDQNSEETIYFTTGDETDSVTATYSPVNGAASVSVNPSITITFSDDVVRYSNGASISTNDNYLMDCLVFRKTNSSGDTVSYSASINSSKNVITITPSYSLALNQKYYVAVVSSRLKTGDHGVAVPSSSVTWTTGATTPIVGAMTLTPTMNTITANVTSNIDGTAYLVALPASYGAVNAAQVVAGQNASNVAVAANLRTNGSISAGTAKAFSFSGLDSNTQYVVYAVINGNGLNSAVKSVLATTSKETTRLTSLEVIPTVNGVPNLGNQINFNESTLTYNIALNTNITTLRINAAGPGNISIDGDPVVPYGSFKDISLSGNNQTIYVVIDKAGTVGTIYRIDVVRTINLDIASLTVTADNNMISDSGDRKYQLATTGAVAVVVSVTTADPYAAVIMNGNSTVNSGSASFNLEASLTDQSFNFSIRSGSDEREYTIKFIRPAPMRPR
jgi:hypothetical protein